MRYNSRTATGRLGRITECISDGGLPKNSLIQRKMEGMARGREVRIIGGKQPV